MGGNSRKTKIEKEKILASISKKIECTTTSSTQLAAALAQIATAVGSTLTSWLLMFRGSSMKSLKILGIQMLSL